ncbi:glucan phosphoethanolaminetransferase (alkaline phosphatase superfamily) [Pseudomonas sp. LAIL14HWK12:I2]|uniref:sulfatase-like hydrolase/transferase n=1 Tax=Pseudomonas TaxID=286 RepID=UPI000875FF75|nr:MULTISPECIES: sulfatase-like hydrolase/transferase [Pseudomonas]TFA81617.1 glucan phosphoethanolaminetransferase (alkaline phosphatase superfamily) [Pseudomonas sp. LAIL14HWK12:I2]SCZ27324.1 Phosphoethanolamine transferase for glucans (OPG), alkaline phosphatase superfamily [Pseudomonas sp. NFIX46]SDB07704.1 Phosphoethanolamine transferase for glucans (OPG), alkaline phosphatase superfamily [Pseudomonas putida]SFQ83347.1 Phosphoethanolamine transferase for glucans (OPG), alkaline phosphatase
MFRYLKELLLIIYLLLYSEYYLDRLNAMGIGLAVLLFGAMFLTLTFALLLTAYIRQTFIRHLFALTLFVSAVFFDVYTRVTADYLTYSSFVSLVYSGGFIQEAAYQYRGAIIHGLLNGLLLLFGIGLKPRHTIPVPNALRIAAPLCGVLLLSAVLFVRAGEGARGLPIMYTPLAYLNLFGYEALHNTVGPREPVTLARNGPAVGHDIVLIIDESISGNYLDINAPFGVHSNLKQARPGVEIFNYGYAASIANCSADTNITLRYGGTRADYMRINSTLPSIWQYAKKAGLRTVYIDAQRTGGNLQNLMNDAEKKDIDEFVQFDQTSVRDRDMAAAAKLIELLNDGKPQLVLINKVGAHFPVHDKYPDAFMAYRPTLPRGQFTEVADTGERTGFNGQPDDWVLYRNAYKNTVLWNVGEFFSRVFAQANLNNALLIYTSDHGQDLHERGNPGLNTHCGGDPVEEEGLVPLVVIQGDQLQTLDWSAQLATNKDRSSHYNIFPTLLQLMGYDLPGIEAVYGKPLSVATADEFTFNYRFNARLGAKPEWKHIDLNSIVTPGEAPTSVAVGQ